MNSNKTMFKILFVLEMSPAEPAKLCLSSPSYLQNYIFRPPSGTDGRPTRPGPVRDGRTDIISYIISYFFCIFYYFSYYWFSSRYSG